MKKWKLSQTCSDLVKRAEKYKYAILVLLVGGVILLFPKDSDKAEPAEPVIAVKVEETLAEQLEQLLGQVDGAGRTKVLLTPSGGTIYEYQTNTRSEAAADGESLQTETVLAAAGSGKEEPLIVRTTNPGYVGAVIICEGADRAAVRLNIVNAVSSLTGLGSDKITVIKMKGK